MSSFKFLILFCALLVNTNSSPISETPEIEDSPLPEADLENVETEKQVKESKLLIPEKNASATELAKSYCSQFDNSCVKCVKAENCSMAVTTVLIKDEGSDVQRKDYELTCIDINSSLKDLKETFGDKKYSILQKKTECESLHLESAEELKANEDEIPGVMDVITSEPTSVETSSIDNTNTTTKTSTKTTPTTSSTTTSTSTTGSTTTTVTSTTENTSSPTSSTTSNPTSSTNSSQMPTTSKDDPTPKSSGGWSFWSFFGGILLTLGLSAIGFVGFKYYKARSGQVGGGGLNYNRF